MPKSIRRKQKLSKTQKKRGGGSFDKAMRRAKELQGRTYADTNDTHYTRLSDMFNPFKRSVAPKSVKQSVRPKSIKSPSLSAKFRAVDSETI